MIEKLSIFTSNDLNPYRNLALEEYLTMHTEPSEMILYLWQNQKTVVIGKNQNAWKECNVEKLNEDGGHLVRRLSGGGAVFHDLGNLNFTFCVRKQNYDVDRQLTVILEALKIMGIQAEKTGRNDITAGGRKFSGNAFYKAGEYCYHHGTLLVDTNQDEMVKYLNVSREKLQSKGVDSVRSRTVNLKELQNDMTVDLLKECLKEGFCRVYGCSAEIFSETRLNEKEILNLETRFASRAWNLGRSIPFTDVLQHRFTWGEVELQLHIDCGRIKEIHMFTDAMDQNMAAEVESALTGEEYDGQILEERLKRISFSSDNEEIIKKNLISLLKGEITDGK
jgi:lipoate-protein ligase A